MEVQERHARTCAIIRDAVFPANPPVAGSGDASRDDARVVSDVSVLCPPLGVHSDNTLASTRVCARQKRERAVPAPLAFSVFHWIPVRKTNRIAPSRRGPAPRGRWQPSGCEGASGSKGAIRSHSQSGIRQPSSLTTRPRFSSLVGSRARPAVSARVPFNRDRP
jgi:hypothetical protein